MFAPRCVALILLVLPSLHAAPPGYADPQLCATCHAKIAQTYARTPMARSFGQVTNELDPATFEHTPSSESFSVFARNGNTYMERHQQAPDGSTINRLERRMDYWFGSGNHARSYLSRNISGDITELPLTWYAENGGHWGMSPAYDVPAHSGFNRKITYRCMFCHNAYPDIAPGSDKWDGSTNFPANLPQGIDCQRCHGPGQQHADTARQGKPLAQVRAAILNPAALAPARQSEICMQCHLETTSLRLPGSVMRLNRTVFSYRPSEPLQDYNLYFDHEPNTGHNNKFEFVSSAYRLRQSACFRATAGALTCTTCHNPHGERQEYTSACNTCHAAKVQQLVAAQKHPASQDCISCHMPKRQPSDALQVTVTDHYIRKRPDHPGAVSVEMNDGNTPAYRGKVVPYYPTNPDPLYLAIAQVRNEANLGEGIPLLEAAGRDAYADLSEAHRQAGNLPKAIAAAREATVNSPGEWRFFRTLGLNLTAAGKLDEAVQALTQAIQLAPRETASIEALAETQAAQSRFAEAVTSLKTAAALDPDSAAIQNNLGTALLRTGQLVPAEVALREAVRLRPELAGMRVNLGTFLARTNRFPSAQIEFEAAIHIDPKYPEAHSAYATALASNGKLEEARDHFQIALRLNPTLATTHNNLGTVLRQLGDTTAAIHEYRLAVAAQPQSATAHYNLGVTLATQQQPDEAEQQLLEAIRYIPAYYEAHLQLGLVLQSKGEIPLAIPHFRKATESPDSAIRQSAISALNKIPN